MTGIDDLPAMDRVALAAAWRHRFKASPPPHMSRDLMRRILAFEVQAARQGGLSTRTRKALARLGTQDKAVASTQAGPPPGTRLLRDWNGTTHIVDVVEDGFLWQGARHRSLSAIARAITGARWSGPRFFGLAARRS